MKIGILDYGAGNLGSIIRMIERANGEAVRVSSKKDILSSEKLIIPGVGSFDHGMNLLHEQNLIESISHAALEQRIPILGICLGMHLMCKSSEEGNLPGLGWIDAVVRRFKPNTGLKIPHMGWNSVDITRSNAILKKDCHQTRFYFVHSYKVECNDESDAIAIAQHGEPFVAAFQHRNLVGVQFHPEKSHRFGLELFRQFLQYKND
jgi:glutamine amidotransferase